MAASLPRWREVAPFQVDDVEDTHNKQTQLTTYIEHKLVIKLVVKFQLMTML